MATRGQNQHQGGISRNKKKKGGGMDPIDQRVQKRRIVHHDEPTS